MTTQANTPGQYRQISTDFLKRVHLALVELIQYIEALSPRKPLRWFVNGKTPVTSLPSFRFTREVEKELLAILQCRCPIDGQSCRTATDSQSSPSVDRNKLMYSVHRDTNGTVTISVFEASRAASIDMAQIFALLERNGQ